MTDQEPHGATYSEPENDGEQVDVESAHSPPTSLPRLGSAVNIPIEPSDPTMPTQAPIEAVSNGHSDPTKSRILITPDSSGESRYDESKREPVDDAFHELFKAPAENAQTSFTKITDKPSVKLAKTKKKKLKAKKAAKGKKGKQGIKKKKKGKRKKKGQKGTRGKGKKKKKRVLKLHSSDHPREFTIMATTPIGSDHGGGSGMGISVPGVMRVTLSSETQKLLGCVVGENVTAESPWVFVNKSLIDDNMDLHSESSDFLPVRDDITDLKTPTVLLGYDALADADNQFYICVTETAQNAVVEILQQMQEDQQKWLQNALEKPCREWKSFGSEQEVDLFTVKNTRPLMQMQVETTIGDLRAPCNFGNRDADDVPDGYFQFSHRDDVPEHVSRLRIDKEVQVSLAKIDVEAQTEPGIPDNSWTQYEYSVDTDKPIEDEVVEQALAKFLQEIQNEICDALHYNELMDLHRDDYGRLVRFEEDTETSQSVQYNEFMSFTDMKHCQGKIVSCAAFHPTCSGIVALAYVDHIKTELSDIQEDPDEIVRSVYAMHPVLMWSFVDAFRPKLILDSPREVHALAFAPQNGDILVGGLANGQIAIWDLQGKIERVEQETKLTPDQVKYHASMNNLMDWMKSTIRIEYMQPSAVSAIDGSHIDMISQIVWLNPCWEINATGQFIRTVDDRQSLQAVTSSLDGTILFWNLDPLAVNIPGLTRKKWPKRPKGLKIEKSIFSNFHRKLKPVFRLEIQSPDEKRLSLAMCMALYSQPVIYEEDLDFVSKLTQTQRESMTTRFLFKPVHPPSEIDDLKNFIMIGAINGSVLALEWEGTEENLADYVNSKMCSRIVKDEQHSSPVFCLKRNPFIKDLYLSVGSKKFSLWSEKLGMSPLLWRYTDETYTDGAWSLQRPSMLQLVKEDGTVEVWDFLIRSDTYIFTQSVSGKTLTGIDAHIQYLPNNVVGIADYNGSYRLFFIPSQFQESDISLDVELMEKLVDREKERRKAMVLWEARWREKNAEQAKLVREQKELENRKQSQLEEDEKNFLAEERKWEEMELEQFQQSRKLIEQMKQKETPKHVAKLAAAEQRWQETRRSHMVRMLLDKKKLKKDDLERRREPFIAAKEAQHKKTLKLRQVLRQRSTIFRDTVKMHFLEVFPTSSHKQTQSEAFAAQLEDMDETFVQRYHEIEKLALEQLKPTSLEQTFNWKRIVQDGRSRREVLDTSLFHQTARVLRAEERREYRRLHRNSEMQREDERKRAKVRAKVGFISSSTSILKGGSDIDIAGGDPGAQESSSELDVRGGDE